MMRNITGIKIQNSKPQGIALLLTVILLGSLIIITTSAAGLIFSLGQTVRSIGESEKAYYAAESGIEQGLYLVEQPGVTADQLFGSGILDTTKATWSRTPIVSYSIPLNHPSVTATDPSADISDTNPLLVTLNANQSFQLDLNLVGTFISYPQHLRITWAGGGTTRLIEYSNTGQNSSAISTNKKIPTTGNITPGDNLRIRLINQSGTTIQYTIDPDPSGAGKLPTGLILSSIGLSGNQERRVEVERKSWLVF